MQSALLVPENCLGSVLVLLGDGDQGDWGMVCRLYYTCWGPVFKIAGNLGHSV
jgi:hypothetical protein